jgi:hypothetical protein
LRHIMRWDMWVSGGVLIGSLVMGRLVFGVLIVGVLIVGVLIVGVLTAARRPVAHWQGGHQTVASQPCRWSKNKVS